MAVDPTVPSDALTPLLSRAGLDELLQELLTRVGDVIDTQDRLRGLLDAVVVIASDLELNRVLAQIVKATSELVDAKYVALGVLGAGPDRRLQEFITHGLSDAEREAIGDLPRGKGVLGHIIDHPEPLRLTDLHSHPDSYGFPPEHPPMKTFLGVPIRIRDKFFGNLYLTEKAGGGDFTVDDEEIVIALAAAAGVVIENARLYQETARREAWLTAAAEITAALLCPIQRQDALQLVADRAREVASADLATVLLAEPGDSLMVQVVSGASPTAVVGQSIPVSGSLAGSVARSGEMFVVEDASLEQSQLSDFAVPADWPSPGPVVILPLRSSAGIDGVLSVVWAKENAHRFYDVDLQLPAAFAEQAALALQVTKAREDQALLAVFEDRDRIGRDLHDLVIQRLFAIGLTLENTIRLIDRQEATNRVTAAVEDIDETIKDVRRTIFSLSEPVDSTDIKKQLSDVLNAAAPALGFTPILRTDGPVETRIPPTLKPHMVAVVTETLSNASRHAAPRTVVVTLSVSSSEVYLEVADDGSGFDPDARARDSGLANVRYRAESLGGSCEVISSLGTGTRVIWRVPLAAVG
jgi:signal transduction histidine kinase